MSRAIFEPDLVITDGLWIDARAYGDAFTDVTLQAAVTDIGADDKTLLLSPGAWAINDSVTIPTNINLSISQGAILTIATAKILTINGPFSAGLYQVFDCVGTGGVILPGKRYPEWWGASPSVVNNTPYLDQAVDSLDGGNFGTLILTQVYPITSQWVIPDLIDFTIDFQGGQISVTGSSGVSFYNLRSGEVKRLDVRYNESPPGNTGWSSLYSGLLLDDVYEVALDIKQISNFYKGLDIEPTGTNAVSYLYNIHLGKMYNNKFDIYIDPGATGYITELSFYGGRFSLQDSLLATASGDYVVYMNSAGIHQINNIRMYNPCFESKHNGIRGHVANFMLIHPRYENVAANWLEYVFGYSIFLLGYGNYNSTYLNLSDQARNNLFLGKDTDSEMTLMMESKYGGLSFTDRYGRSSVHKFSSTATGNALIIDNADGTNLLLNKSYEGTSVPVTGSYRVGSIVWNASPASGESIGWMCATTGTMGTLVGITASCTNGEDHLELSSVADVHVGAFIAVVGVTGSKQVTGIVGTTVYVTSVVDATVVGAAVSYVAGTFIQIGAQVSYRSGAGAPGVDALFIGEEYLNTTGNHWYKAHVVGTGAGDWTALN